MDQIAAQQETTEDPVFASAAPANDQEPTLAEASAEAAPAQTEVTPEGAEARADLYKGLYDDDGGAQGAAANDNAQQGGAASSTLDKLKDSAISAGTKFGLKEVIKKGAKLGGPLAGALAGGAVSAVENLQAYRDGKVSGLRAVGNTVVDAAAGALPFGVSTLAKWGAKKLGLYKPAS